MPSNPSMKFYLFTYQNFQLEQELFLDDKAVLLKSNYQSIWPVRIIVHDWQNYLRSCITAYIKDAYLEKGHFNVIVVDWSDWAGNQDYSTTVQYISYTLAQILSFFILFLNAQGNTPFDNIYIIGHGMGAHMAGGAGHHILPNKINTIYALDPSGPGFQDNKLNSRLDPSDAKYVEQITTNMGEFGYIGLIGHAAFYPNYGRVQHYCWLNKSNGKYCDHYTAIWYFTESINSKRRFCGTACSFEPSLYYESIYTGSGCSTKMCYPKIIMGGEPSKPKTGTFYLNTKYNPPFANCKNCKSIK